MWGKWEPRTSSDASTLKVLHSGPRPRFSVYVRIIVLCLYIWKAHSKIQTNLTENLAPWIYLSTQLLGIDPQASDKALKIFPPSNIFHMSRGHLGHTPEQCKLRTQILSLRLKLVEPVCTPKKTKACVPTGLQIMDTHHMDVYTVYILFTCFCQWRPVYSIYIAMFLMKQIWSFTLIMSFSVGILSIMLGNN